MLWYLDSLLYCVHFLIILRISWAKWLSLWILLELLVSGLIRLVMLFGISLWICDIASGLAAVNNTNIVIPKEYISEVKSALCPL